MKKLLINLLVSFIAVCFAQVQQISGTITEAETAAPLPGATVIVMGTTNEISIDFGSGLWSFTFIKSKNMNFLPKINNK